VGKSWRRRYVIVLGEEEAQVGAGVPLANVLEVALQRVRPVRKLRLYIRRGKWHKHKRLLFNTSVCQELVQVKHFGVPALHCKGVSSCGVAGL
jgi:hypothetical protein